MNPHIPLSGHPSHSSLLVPFMLGASKGCRGGAAGQSSEGQLPRAPVAAHRIKILHNPLHVLCYTGLLRLHLSDLLTELLAQSPVLGQREGGVSPRAPFGPGPLQPPWRGQCLAFSTSPAAAPQQREGVQTPEEVWGEQPGLGRAFTSASSFSLASSLCFNSLRKAKGLSSAPSSGSPFSWTSRSRRPRCKSNPFRRLCSCSKSTIPILDDPRAVSSMWPRVTPAIAADLSKSTELT